MSRMQKPVLPPLMKVPCLHQDIWCWFFFVSAACNYSQASSISHPVRYHEQINTNDPVTGICILLGRLPHLLLFWVRLWCTAYFV
ncbi:hypothetical protein GGR55DRAFT_643391 [Xylaria sp. FL0064]|nr:hypothetical protein GGR55DRAFT_643391 [Xylaria sp. FL0064]